MEEKFSTLSHKTCGLCSACAISNDCTKCENCIRNYIDVNINRAQNSTLRRCLKRICRTSGSDTGMQAGDKSDPLGQTDYKNSRTPKSNISILQDVNNSLSVLELTEFKTGVSKNCGKWLDSISGDTETKTAAEKTNINLAALDEFSDESDNEPSLEKCGDCSGCVAPDCGSCWPCIERDVQISSSNPCTGKTCRRLQSKIKTTDSINEEKEIEVQKQESKILSRGPRTRCGKCPGCKTAQNCGVCTACIRKKKNKLFTQTCNLRRCHVLISEKSQRCGQCESCQSLPCEDCGHCKAGQEQFCRAKRCKNPTWVKIKKRIPKNKESKSVEFIQQVSSENGMDSEKESFGDSQSKTLSRKEVEQNGNKVSEDIEVHNDKLKNSTWVKIKKRIPKNKKIKSVEFINQVYSENEMDSEVESFGDPQSKTLSRKEDKQNEKDGVSDDVDRHEEQKQSKHIKRTKKCKKCDSCKAQDCGNCQSCKMNQKFGEKIVLGKLPCLTNICKFPVELALGKDKLDKLGLLAEQDDAPEGSVCPVKEVQGRLYDARCYFCKKLPRMGKVSRSELIRHYAVNHFNKELKDEFAGVTFCRQCNLEVKVEAANHFAVHHFGQKHEEVVKYLPREAVLLFPEKKHQRSIVRRKVKKVEWPQVPEGFDPASNTRDWKRDSHDDLIQDEKVECEIVNGWTIEHQIDELEEPPPSLNEPDFTGIGGVCSVCQIEYPQVTATAMHLHQDHHIQGGSSYIMRDCDKLIKSGFIKLVPQENGKGGNAISEIAVKAAESSEVCTLSRNFDGYKNFNSKRSVARKSTSRKSRSFSTAKKEPITRGNSQHSSSNDEETSAYCDEMERLPATIHDKDDDNSTPSLNSDGCLGFQPKKNVAWKSTSKKSRSPCSTTARKSSTTSFKFDSKKLSADSRSVFEGEAQGQLGDSDSCSSHAEYTSPFWEAIGVKYHEEDEQK